MKNYAGQIVLLAVVSLSSYAEVSNGGSVLSPQNNGKNEQVKILDGCVELVELKAESENCPKSNQATSVRLRVTCENPVDVRMHYQNTRGKWASKDFLNRKRGDEITDFVCAPKSQYKIQSRAAGGSSTWPKP